MLCAMSFEGIGVSGRIGWKLRPPLVLREFWFVLRFGKL